MKNKLWLLLSMSALQLSPLLISTAQADLLDDIKQKKEIVIATEARYAPFEMLEDGKIVGLGKDILTEVMKGLPGVKVVQLDIPFQGILPGLAGDNHALEIFGAINAAIPFAFQNGHAGVRKGSGKSKFCFTIASDG